MPQLTTVSLNDTKSTPVAHAFKPRSIDGGVATLVESTGSPLGERRITVSVNRASTGKVKVVIKMAFPVVETVTINGVTKPVVTRTNYAEATFNFDGMSTREERNDMRSMLEQFLLGTNPLAGPVIVDLEGLF